MNELLAEVLEAHGGLERWRSFEKVEASIVTGGGLFALKGLEQETDPRRMTVRLHEQRSSAMPDAAPDQRITFTPDRIAVERLDGTVVAERLAPLDSFAGHQMNTPWDPLHRAYFLGEALWTYLTTPFLLAFDGVRVEETDSWEQNGEAWRVLRAWFPGTVQTHNSVQDFFFDNNRMLRRHDYRVNIAGGFPVTQLTTQHVIADGFCLPTRRRAYARGPDGRPVLDLLMVAIDLGELKFS